MHYNYVIDTLQNLINRKPTQIELAKILNVGQTAIANRAARDSRFSDDELELLENHFNVILPRGGNLTGGGAVEITYLQHDKLKTEIINKKVTSVWLDKEIVCDVWGKDPKMLRIMQMPGDRMSGNGAYTFKRGDILLINTADTEFPNGGIFAYLFDHEEHIGVSQIELRPKGIVEFSFFNEAFRTRQHSQEELNELGFKIVGRVIKNLSFKL